MKKTVIIFIASVVSIMIINFVIWYGLTSFWQNKTKSLYQYAISNCDKKYAYLTARGSLNPTMYADNKEGGIKLLHYYNEIDTYYKMVEAGKISRVKTYFPLTSDSAYEEPIIIPVPIKNIGVMQAVYVSESNDSIAKVYVFNTSCWGYFEAYIPRINLHDTLPSDSLIQDFEKYLESLPKSDGSYGRPSPYGFYCN